MTDSALHRRLARQASTAWAQDRPAAAQCGAYLAGTEAVALDTAACPFSAAALPILAEAWLRGRSDALAFAAGRRDRLSARCRPRSAVGTTSAAFSHPRD